jgi:hypothetical protein
MKKIILRYGAYASLFEFIAFVLTWLIIDITNVEHKLQGAIGLVTILLPLIFVYFGIRYYRDRINDSSITFLRALRVGLLIVIIPAVSFAIIETIYVSYINPRFYQNIAAFDIEQNRKTLSPAQFAVKLNEIKQETAMNNNPFYNFFGMILYIGALGVIVTLLSSLLLMRRVKTKQLINKI